jgi:hypothetical protein
MSRKHNGSEPSRVKLITEMQVEPAHVAFILNEAELHLARMEPSVTRRRLQAAIDIFWSTVDGWTVRPPTGEQLNLIRDHVAEVLELAKCQAA